MGARMIDEMHVMDARGTGRHAAQARETAIEMMRRARIGRPVVLEHLLDEIDAAARTIEFVAGQEKGRAGRRAEAAMHAGAKDFFRLRHVGIFEKSRREMRLHRIRTPRKAGRAPEYAQDRSFPSRDERAPRARRASAERRRRGL